MCQGKNKRGRGQKSLENSAFNSSHVEIHIAYLHIKGAKDSCNKGTRMASFNPAFPIFIEHRPLCLDTLRSIPWSSVLQTVSLGNTGLQKLSETSFALHLLLLLLQSTGLLAFRRGFRPT